MKKKKRKKTEMGVNKNNVNANIKTPEKPLILFKGLNEWLSYGCLRSKAMLDCSFIYGNIYPFSFHLSRKC